MKKQQSSGGAGIRESILAFLSNSDYEPMPQRVLMHRMHVDPQQRGEFRRALQELRRSGKVIRLSRGRLARARGGAEVTSERGDGSSVTGILQRNRAGFGFVVSDSGGDDLYIPAHDLGEGMTGDRVLARVTGRGKSGRVRGRIEETLERRSRRVLGLFREDDRGGDVFPFDPSVGETIHVPGAFRMGAKDRHAVWIEILRPPGPDRPPEGKILEDLGQFDRPGTDERVVAAKYGLAGSFPRGALAAAERLPSRVGPKEARSRRRFDNPAPVTIDGETAKDFDDAVAVEELPRGRFRLYVHIADVGHFVHPEDPLDEEAFKRGTSVYFPGRVIPMFPEKLSNDLCSLRPGVDRLVQSAILEIDPDGKITKARFVDGVIRSAARLTYTQVARVLAGEKRVAGVPAKVLPMLHAAGRLRGVLEGMRHARGSVDFDLPEPQILLDVEGVMTGVRVEPRNEAHRLIEEFMLIANEAVAAQLENRGGPCMFRVHDEPDPTKVDALSEFAGQFGLRLDLREGAIAPGDIGRLLEQVEGKPEHAVLAMVALRSMKQARYSMENVGHFGLAAPTYAHFTSPIRRYPDLVVHRLLRASRAGDDEAVAARSDLEAVAASCSTTERNAEAAERELLSWKKVAFIESEVGREFAGIVTGVARFGLFVQIEENLVEGLVRVEQLGEERFEYVENKMELRGDRSGKRFRLGDALEVRVERVDRILRRVDFTLVSAEAPKAEPRGSRGKRRRRSR